MYTETREQRDREDRLVPPSRHAPCRPAGGCIQWICRMEAWTMGRTTLEIDEALLEAAMQLSGARTKTEAIELALRELIRKREREQLKAELGSFDLDLDLKELRRLRRAS